jgi:hypothetical protein
MLATGAPTESRNRNKRPSESLWRGRSHLRDLTISRHVLALSACEPVTRWNAVSLIWFVLKKRVSESTRFERGCYENTLMRDEHVADERPRQY